VSDPSNERRNGNGKINWQAVGVVLAILTAAYAVAEANGGQKSAVAQIERRLDRMEGFAADIAELRAQVRFLVAAEQRRQGGRGGE